MKYYEGTTLKTTDYYDYDGLNQVVVEDHKDHQQSTASSTKVYQYDTHGNRTAVHQYAYEGRPTISIPTSYYTNTGNMPVVPYYNGSSWSTFCFIEVGGSIPSFSFEYYEEEYWFSIPATTSLVSLHYDAFHKGYYEAVYRAVNVQYGVDVTFNIRIGVGHLFVATPQIQSQYQYNSPWLDQLSSYDILGTTHPLTYDSQGNPTTITNFAYKGGNYHHANLSWDGRALRTIEVYNASDVLVATISYRYNDQGYRTEKDIYEVATNTTQTITYTLSGDKVLYESDGTYLITYTYDYDGTIIQFYYDSNIGDTVSGADYFYLRNQQGDITTIIDNGGNILVKYRYDAYGNILGLVDNSIGDIISAMNPYTYRGYRYDSEIGYYYLNSRYYNPEIGRFINADGIEYLGANEDLLSYNLYAYCSNNPVMNVDPSGNFFGIGTIVGTIIGALSGVVTGLACGNDDLWKYVVIGALTGFSTGLAVDTFGTSYAITSSLGFGIGVVSDVTTQLWIEKKEKINFGRALISGGINALLARTGSQINGLTAGLSSVGYITSQIMLGGSASLLGIGYSVISSYYYNRVRNSESMILEK